MAAPTYRTAAGANAGSDPLTVTNPGVTAGEWLIAVVHAVGTGAFSSLDGFTAYSAAVTNATKISQVWTKKATGSEPASWRWNNANSTNARTGVVYIVTGAHATDPVHKYGTPSTFGAVNSYTTPTVTTEVAECLVLGMAGVNDNVTLTSSAMSNFTTASRNGSQAAIGSNTQLVAGSAGGKAISAGSNIEAVTYTLAIQPPTPVSVGAEFFGFIPS